jgi:hypothetical protein
MGVDQPGASIRLASGLGRCDGTVTDLLFRYPIIFWTAAHELARPTGPVQAGRLDFTRLSGTNRDRTNHEGPGERMPSASVN